MEPHILFADDNPDICELVQMLLQAAGFRMSASDNAADVLRRVTTESFAAVILDYWMQEATGIDLCRQIIGALRSILKAPLADSAFTNG